MASARRAGEVKAIGLHGSVAAIMVAMEFFKDQRKEIPVNILALDINPASEIDQSSLIRFRKLYVEEIPKVLVVALFFLFSGRFIALPIVARGFIGFKWHPRDHLE